ncbi:MAG TPA: hypothetical protein VGL22_09285 [Terracidiphilus sp.]
MKTRHTRVWLMIASIAIVAALLLMLVPHGVPGHAADWLAILPVLFAGVLALPGPRKALASCDGADLPHAPVLPQLFQRPPPFLFA